MVRYTHKDTFRNGGAGLPGYRKAKKCIVISGATTVPVGSFFYNRAYLIEHGVFSTDELAPDTELPFRMHMNDYNPILDVTYVQSLARASLVNLSPKYVA